MECTELYNCSYYLKPSIPGCQNAEKKSKGGKSSSTIRLTVSHFVPSI